MLIVLFPILTLVFANVVTSVRFVCVMTRDWEF